MSLAGHIENRPVVVPMHGGRSPVETEAHLGDLVARVQALRPRLTDAWEATALVESLGYTDRRVKREFGFADTRAAGDYVFRAGGQRPSDAQWTPPKRASVLAIVGRSAASSLIYAVPWLAVFAAQTIRPDAMRMPEILAPALSLALIFSLIASGGLVQAIVRRGEFYVGLGQIGLARRVVAALLRIGISIVLGASVVGLVAGWYFKLFTWPALVLGADAFIIMSVLWLVCGVFAIRQQQWRVAVAFAVGFVTFAFMRASGTDVVTAQLTAASAVLIAASVQAKRLFHDAGSKPELSRRVPMPRMSVLAYYTVPYFWYGTVYFAFLFTDRLTAGSAFAAWYGAPFSMPTQYNLGMELALLTLLVGASGVEVAGALFARAFTNTGTSPMAGGERSLSANVCRHHTRALAFTVGAFVVAATTIVLLARRALPDTLTTYAWTTLLAGDVGYGCLAVGLLNSLVLFETRRAWTVVQTFTTALVINLVVGYVLSHALGTFQALNGLLLGAGYFAFASTLTVRRMLKDPAYAYAAS